MKSHNYRLKLFLFIFAILFFLVVVGYFWIYQTQLSFNVYSKAVIKNYSAESENNDNDKKHILFWTKFFDIKFWGMLTETYYEDYLKSISCPVTNCVFTHKKNLLKHHHEYSAIFFHDAEKWSRFMKLPETRNPQQVYVMASQE